MEFIVDKETKTVSITKEFDAELRPGLGRIYQTGTSRPMVGTKTLGIENKGYGIQRRRAEILRDGQPRR